MKITKNQIRQIIREELAIAVNESPDVFGADYSPAEKVKNIIAPEQAERDQAMTHNLRGAMEGDIKVKEGDTLWDLQQSGKLRGASIDDVIEYNDLDPKNLEIGSTIKLPPSVPASMHIDSTLEMDGKELGAQAAKHTMAEQGKGGHGGDPNMHKIDSEFISKETGGTGGLGDEAQDKTTVVSDKDTFKSRQRSSRGSGKLDSYESDTSLVDNTGKRQSSTYRNKGDVSFDSFKQTPAGGSRAKASSKNPLGLGKAKGAFGGETLKKGDKKLNIGDKDYLSTLQKVGLPGVPEAGEDDNLIADLNETFKRWKKLIK